MAEVLQSAETMKRSVAYLEPFMEKAEGQQKGTIVLATVKGDVHDIGKNLVDIILTNNGYEVINLGIKVPPEELIKAFRQHKPDAIGLSGLLVKSAQQMVITALDLKEAGVQVPMLVGGAALSDSFTRKKIAPSYESITCYAKDAMQGLDLLNKLMDPGAREALVAAQKAKADHPEAEAPQGPDSTVRSSRASLAYPPVPPPYPQRIARAVPQLEEVWSYLSPAMLYTHHLGFRGNFEKKLAERDPKALELQAIMQEIRGEAAKFLKLKAVWRYCEAEAEGNSIRMYEPGAAEPAATFTFPRQRREDGLCLADYVMPASNGAQNGGAQNGSTGARDSVGVFVVTAGEGVRERAEEYKARGEYLKMHAVQALALETAEACAGGCTAACASWAFPTRPS